MEDVYCHHFVFVRAHFNNVLEKLVQSHVSEKQPYTSMDQWIPRVWNRLPDYDRALCPDGFHPAIGFESNWQELAEVSRDQLPAVLAQHPNVFAFGRS